MQADDDRRLEASLYLWLVNVGIKTHLPVYQEALYDSVLAEAGIFKERFKRLGCLALRKLWPSMLL